MTTKEKIAQAYERGNYWKATLNEREETGKSAKLIAEAERKGQYWLDRLNKLENLS